jgi:hypothetical protein
MVFYFRSLLRLQVNANVVPSLSILASLMMEAIRSSETSVLKRATRRNIPEDGILRLNFACVTDLYMQIAIISLSGINRAVLTKTVFPVR